MNGYILGGEQTRHRLADASIAADHHMILHLARVLRRQVVAMVEPLQPLSEPSAAAGAERRHHHADADHGGGGSAPCRPESSPLDARETDHDERELAALRQQDRDLGGNRRADTEHRGSQRTGRRS